MAFCIIVQPPPYDPGNYAVEWLLLGLALGLGALLHAELMLAGALERACVHAPAMA